MLADEGQVHVNLACSLSQCTVQQLSESDLQWCIRAEGPIEVAVHPDQSGASGENAMGMMDRDCERAGDHLREIVYEPGSGLRWRAREELFLSALQLVAQLGFPNDLI